MSGAATGVQKQSAPQPIPWQGLEVVVVEDDAADCELVLRELKRTKFVVAARTAQSKEDFRQLIRTRPPDIVLSDYNLGGWWGMDTLEVMQQEGVQAPLILVSGALGDVTAVECIKNGATDYVLKDALARLPICIERALQEQKLKAEKRYAIEELAARAKELARSNQELEQFAYVASHDLQEPLRMVASYTQLLAERYRGKLDETADKYIGYAVEGAIRMQTLIQDMLAYSRAGRHGTELSATDCNLVLAGAVQSLQGAIQESNAEIRNERLPVVLANRTQLLQVFQNLVGNAIKFRGEQRPEIAISAQAQGHHWLFTVADNGIGIPVEFAEEVFVIFKRLHTRTEYSGNGIGLAICKRIIEQCGGTIWVERHTGPGTTFKFTLQAAQGQRESLQRQESIVHHENRTASISS